MKKYKSEAVLLTKSVNEDELICWLEWHLNIVKFDHISVYDNESLIDAKSICEKYSDKVSYYSIKGFPDQYNLYNDHLKVTDAKWMITLDDDEFLYIGDKFNNNVNELIDYMSDKFDHNMFYPLWLLLFSKEYIESRNDLYINTHTCYSYELDKHLRNSIWCMNNQMGKAFINTDYSYKYSIKHAHIPKCLDSDKLPILIDGNETDNFIVKRDLANLNTDCFIAHYQFKNNQEWHRKCKSKVACINMATIARFKDAYKEVYKKYADLLIPFTLVKNTWEQYVGKQ